MNKNSTVAMCFSCCAAVLLVFSVPLFGQPPSIGQQPATKRESAAKQEKKATDPSAPPAFKIDQPGTITFTVGMVIKGKVEKPQVVIFLPKEKPFYRELKFTHSFADEIRDPLPFTPIVE